MSVQFKICSYNLHGFNQGRSYLEVLCEHADVILIQEHWLFSDELYKLSDVCPNMVCFGSSSMDDVSCRRILHGRPFGGIAILVNNTVAKIAKFIKHTDRYIVVALGLNLLICVYLPCASSNQLWSDLYLNILYEIESDLLNTSYDNIIIAGDWNIDFNYPHPLKNEVISFFNRNNLTLVDNFITGDNKFSFRVESSGSCSLIDHFVVSSKYVAAVKKIEILDDALNLSDHCPVMCYLMLDMIKCDKIDSCETVKDNQIIYRWDKSDLNLYSTITESMLNKVLVPRFLLNDKSSDKMVKFGINKFYHDIVRALTNSANTCRLFVKRKKISSNSGGMRNCNFTRKML